MTFLNPFCTLQVSSVSTSLVASSTSHLILALGKDKGNSNVIFSVISLLNLPIIFIFPFLAQYPKVFSSILTSSKEGGIITLFSSNEKSISSSKGLILPSFSIVSFVLLIAISVANGLACSWSKSETPKTSSLLVDIVTFPESSKSIPLYSSSSKVPSQSKSPCAWDPFSTSTLSLRIHFVSFSAFSPFIITIIFTLIESPLVIPWVKRVAKKNENPFIPFGFKWLICLKETGLLILSSTSFKWPLRQVRFSSGAILPIFNISSGPSFIIVCSTIIWPLISLSTWHLILLLSFLPSSNKQFNEAPSGNVKGRLNVDKPCISSDEVPSIINEPSSLHELWSIFVKVKVIGILFLFFSSA